MSANISINQALTEIANLYRHIYFEAMIIDDFQTVEDLKKSQHRFLDGILDKLHNKYKTNIQNLRKELQQIK